MFKLSGCKDRTCGKFEFVTKTLLFLYFNSICIIIENHII